MSYDVNAYVTFELPGDSHVAKNCVTDLGLTNLPRTFENEHNINVYICFTCEYKLKKKKINIHCNIKYQIDLYKNITNLHFLGWFCELVLRIVFLKQPLPTIAFTVLLLQFSS